MADPILDEPEAREETIPLPSLMDDAEWALGNGSVAASRRRLRADLLTRRVDVTPGEPVSVVVQVLNTSDVIETVDVEVDGPMPDSVDITPPEVTLFPGESTQVTLELRYHRALSAGEHTATVIVSGRTGQSRPAHLPLRLVVPPVAGAELTAEPPLRVAGRRTEFDLLVQNKGNTPLRMRVSATDADRRLRLHVDSLGGLHVRVDETADLKLHAKGRRPWAGTPTEHLITVLAEGEGLTESTEVRFRQKPVLTPGIITILTLVLIVALWALAMMIGVRLALAPAPPTKVLPESFASGVGIGDLDAIAVGGTVAGTVTATSTGQPLARVTIEALDLDGRVVGATATGDDGTYALEGLLPVRHYLRIRAAGYEDLWWPGTTSAADASPLTVIAAAVLPAVDIQLAGLPGTLGGQAIAGDGDPHEIAVEVAALDLLDAGPPVTTLADAAGMWTVGGLPAPATYRVTYRADGYAPVEVTQVLDGGGQVVMNTVRLPAGSGAINGVVLDQGGLPVGGVEVVAQRGDFALALVTPTSGDVGAFSLTSLETPATYLVTFTAAGYAPETRAIRLGPGEALDGYEVVLSPASGVVFGQATTSDGRPLGGVRVTVSGGGTVLTTDTFTSGAVGSFRLPGLPLPGVYAVTFDADGYARQTIQVELHRDSPQAFAEVRMTASVGRISGRVVDASGAPLGAVTIEISDGSTVRTTTTASAPASQAGRFTVGDLSPGTYTVTARVPGRGTVTVLQVVDAAGTHDLTLRVAGSP